MRYPDGCLSRAPDVEMGPCQVNPLTYSQTMDRRAGVRRELDPIMAQRHSLRSFAGTSRFVWTGLCSRKIGPTVKKLFLSETHHSVSGRVMSKTDEQIA